MTEEIYSYLPVTDKKSIMISDWSIAKDELNFSVEEEMLETIKEAIKGVRNMRSEMDVPPSKKAKLVIVTEEKGINSMDGKFSLTIHIRNYDNIIKWFNNETERNEYFNHLCKIMC